jgi:hypothetical protein
MSKILKLFTALILMLFCFQHPPAFAIDGDQENYLSEKQGLPDCAPILQQNDLIHPPNYGLIQIQFVYIENQSPKTVYMRKEYIPYRQVQKRNYKHIQKQRLSAKTVNKTILNSRPTIGLPKSNLFT